MGGNERAAVAALIHKARAAGQTVQQVRDAVEAALHAATEGGKKK